MRDEKEERKKQARSNKQTRQSNTAHPRQSLFRAASGGTRTHDTLHSRQSALPAELPRLSPYLTSHGTLDEQANHQLSMKEKAGMYVYNHTVYDVYLWGEELVHCIIIRRRISDDYVIIGGITVWMAVNAVIAREHTDLLGAQDARLWVQ